MSDYSRKQQREEYHRKWANKSARKMKRRRTEAPPVPKCRKCGQEKCKTTLVFFRKYPGEARAGGRLRNIKDCQKAELDLG